MTVPNTNTKVPTPSNPSSLKSRYSIRKLEPKHGPWAAAIIIHSNLFHSPVWPVLYPKNITENVHKSLAAASYLVDHQITSGMSFGVFDDEYVFKRPESEEVGGKLYWDDNEKSVEETQGLEAESLRLAEQMDFPLVSVALSYDSSDPLDFDKMGPLLACLPHFGLIYHILAELDSRDPASWQAKAHNEVLFRNATSTRREYEGEKLMSGLARWLMREADVRGWRGIQIECVHDKVSYTWANPEKPYKGTIVSKFDTKTWTNEEGKKAFEPADQVITKVYVDLKPEA
ncbi:uncharacterized protein BDR25DRAFT_307318 [Lindgomyces ingoldianus]|uniref:Uncharacterized protein n=1 Tax=Lindgomyces ingoldianus TaxID=673940 RepID=A0ACB6QBJ4_9PLEO|nr:uncharacterized protein BDR25DRAFT_307318 [Lindgomyces ingoldianus]KAF2464338.1 hypothetical protein BDR25DRAFT_307318 [Lindgomyces ingoldianus]